MWAIPSSKSSPDAVKWRSSLIIRYWSRAATGSSADERGEEIRRTVHNEDNALALRVALWLSNICTKAIDLFFAPCRLSGVNLALSCVSRLLITAAPVERRSYH